jgi:AAA family ATP:ADP antiporter
MLGAAAMLGLCMVLTSVIHARESHRKANPEPGAAAPAAVDVAEQPIGGRNGFALVFADRYLLLIALLMLIYNVVNTTGEYILGRTVVSLYTAAHGAAAVGGLDEKKVIGEFYGNYFTVVNIISALLQGFVVSRVLKRFGVRVALLVLPVVAMFGYVAMAFVPLMSFIRSAKVAENSLDYSLQNTTKNALYLPTSREAKYKAKQAIDSFFVRLGDLLQAVVVFVGTLMAFGIGQFAILNLVFVSLSLVIVVAIGREYQKRTAEKPSEQAA